MTPDKILASEDDAFRTLVQSNQAIRRLMIRVAAATVVVALIVLGVILRFRSEQAAEFDRSRQRGDITRTLQCLDLRLDGGNAPTCDRLLGPIPAGARPSVDTARLVCDLQRQLHDSLGLVDVSKDCP